MYLMSAFATRGAGTKSVFMHDKSPVINFRLRFNRLLIFIRLVSSSVAVPFDGDKTNPNFASLDSAKMFSR